MAVVPSGQAGEGLTERDRQREETRRRVREVALGVIRRDGLGDARVDEIARAAGVSRGTVYFHYPTKEHVVGEVLGEAEGRIATALRELPRGASIDAVLDAFCGAFVREWEKEARLFPAVAEVAVRASAAAIGSTEPDAMNRVVAARFRLAAERGELRSALRAPLLANVFLMSVLSATLAWSVRPRGVRLATVLASTVELFLDGARSR